MPPPRGGGALLRNLSDNSVHSGASLSGQNATENLTPEEQAKAERDANILAGGGLGLDPENDPVIFTTDYGLEIKSHNAGELTASIKTSSGPTTIGGASYNYVSAGGYYWIIIGQYSSSSYTMSDTIKASEDEYATTKQYDNSDAGNEIYSASSNGIYQLNITIPKIPYALVPSNGEIPKGCVLCLSAGNIGTTRYGSSGSYFPDSKLETAMTDIYDSIKSSLKIRLTPLKTNGAQSGAANTNYTHSAYLFPLATTGNGIYTSQNFCVETYLNTEEKRTIEDGRWWTRTGRTYDTAYQVTHKGEITTTYGSISGNYGVRPAFVLQLYSA